MNRCAPLCQRDAQLRSRAAGGHARDAARLLRPCRALCGGAGDGAAHGIAAGRELRACGSEEGDLHCRRSYSARHAFRLNRQRIVALAWHSALT